MSQVKLTLQAPPNVDFVQGYPGIPPGPGRPQATVQGALEVRTPQGVKAKWITIELRKVETLPGGGVANTFYDSVPGPIKLWEASQDSDYELLRSQDFAFTIRIPESIPPTLNLDDRGSGIKYELVGSICVKGSKGFLRRRKEVISSTTTPIMMSKHELHSTWPVYCQPEVRQVSDNEGMMMTVSRDRTCFGPNCAIAAMVALKSEKTGSIILRGFEMQLVETMALTTAHTATKRALTQTHETVRAECKLPVNMSLFGGQQRQVELRCLVPPHHACSTVNSARHIDITYNLNIKAFISNGQQIALKLPVVVSSWPQEYSAEAVKLIGPAPGLSLIPVSNIPLDPHHNVSQAPNTYSGRPTPNQQPEMSLGRPGLAATFGPTSTQASNFSSALRPIDEFGRAGPPITTIETQSMKPGRINQPIDVSRSSMYQGDDFSGSSNTGSQANNTSGPGTGRRPQSARSGQNANRLTITNAMPSEIPDGDDNSHHQRNNSAGGSDPTKKKPNRAWPTAEEEKQRLYEQARAQVERTQGGVARVNTPPLRTVSPPQPESTLETSPSHTTPSRGNKWLTAEEEKLRLFNEAQAAVQLTQYGGYSPPSAPAPQSRNGPMMDTPQAASPAARMYMEAMSSRNKSSNLPPNQPSSSSSKSPPPAKASVPKTGPQYMSAVEEKAAMRRFQEAKDAVDRTQRSLASSPASHSAALSAEGPAPDPIAYESLYPANPGNPPPQPMGDDLPPPFETSVSSPKISEKERLRRNYEAQDNAARAAQRNGSQRGQRQNGVKANASPPPAAIVPPRSDSPPSFNATQDPISQAISEKERIRRHYEQQDALAAAHSAAHAPPYADVSSSSQSRPTPTPPPRAGSISSSARARPPPVPPTAAASSIVPMNARPLTAAEEKALLRAKYEAEEAKPPSLRSDSPQSQYSRPGSTSPNYPSYAPMSPPATKTPPPPMPPQTQVAPPPLMPRPPAEYIQETQEEDARVSRIAVNGMLPLLDHPPPSKMTSSVPPFSSTPAPRANGVNGVGGASGNIMIDTRPFTPFSSSFENAIKLPGPPPPLPSKPAGE